MKPVIYTLTEAGVLVPAEVTQADLQQAYDLGFAFGQLAGQRLAYVEMERVAAESRRGISELTPEDVEAAKRRMLH